MLAETVVKSMTGPSMEGTVLLPTALNLLNALFLGVLFVVLPRVRRSPGVRFAVLLYMTVCLGLQVIASIELSPQVMTAFFIASLSAYLPLFGYILSASTEILVELMLLRVQPIKCSRRLPRWADDAFARLRGRIDQALLEAKLQELAIGRTRPLIHRELVELHLKLGDTERGVYHAYALVEMLPRGHAHALALFRLAQIIGARQARPEAAQPHLRRIIRLYPRSIFAREARRLVHEYEAFADRS